MLSTLLTRPCTITHRSDGDDTDGNNADEYGNDTPTETTVNTVCELQQRQRSEDAAQGEISDTTWLLVLPAGTSISTADTVTVAAETFEVIGAPWPARNPRTGVESHIEATLRRTAGAA